MKWQGSGSYERVSRPGHPMADASGHVVLHRLIMAEKLGRSLRSDEHVHHINGDHKDNRPENLEVMTNVEHTKRHWEAGDFENVIGPRKESAFEGVGQLIYALRKAAGIKQGELGDTVGCSGTVICSFEKGQRAITYDSLVQILVAIDEIRAAREAEFMAIIERIVENRGYALDTSL